MAKKKNKIKVGVIYNESAPEMYGAQAKTESGDLKFIPYFEIEHQSPIDEFKEIAGFLCKQGYEAYSFNIHDSLDKLLDHLTTEKPDVVFNFVEVFGISSRYEMNIAGIYEMLGIHYTGAPVLTLANCQDKILTKKLLRSSGIQVPDFELVSEPIENLPRHLKFPVIIKPAYEDASVGIEHDAVVRDEKRLRERIAYIHNHFKQPAIVDQYIDGRELNVSVVGDEEPEALPISEIDFSEMPGHLDKIVSYQAKWDPHHEAYHRTIPICPAPLTANMTKKIQKIAVNAFRTMNCRDYARIDCRMNKNGDVFVLEVNPNPDLTEGAGFMRSAEAAGYKYGKMLARIVDSAVQRKLRSKI
ncbi:MAG: hypothetical protein AMXMBFR48_24880 [Ignavibacteriales bacterium]|jgi:D-alanine-D-alanine ligase